MLFIHLNINCHALYTFKYKLPCSIHLNINCHALYTFKYKLLFSLHIKMKFVTLPLHSMEIVSLPLLQKWKLSLTFT